MLEVLSGKRRCAYAHTGVLRADQCETGLEYSKNRCTAGSTAVMGKRVAGRKWMGGCCCCPAHLSYTRTLHFNADVEFRLATDQKTQSANQNINTSMSAVLFFFFFFFCKGPVETALGVSKWAEMIGFLFSQALTRSRISFLKLWRVT